MDKIAGAEQNPEAQRSGTVADGIDSREALLARVRAGARIKYLCYWGHRPLPDGSIGPSCLSQWWPSPFTVDGVEYATAEHWMMAGKAQLFADAEAERRVLAAAHPAGAKKAGRLVRGFDEAVWERERFRIVVEGSVHKFASDPALRAFLLGTGGRVLVEASPVDRVWGIGLAADDEAAQDPERWRGPNLLGFALMAARERLRAGG
ncbi:NADAR family protein [Streptomyces tendae]